MTAPHSNCPSLLLYGTWRQHPESTHQHFCGRVLESDHPSIRKGERVVVTYECAEEWVVGPYEHGTYLLNTSRLKLPLISFLCEALRQSRQGQQNQKTSIPWVAVAVLDPAIPLVKSTTSSPHSAQAGIPGYGPLAGPKFAWPDSSLDAAKTPHSG